ncbi:hypothetical protein B0J12DRAFT_20556 [Macrophomina phaseolina]|uniref:Uncharacterized protein n=1 Tax=Macrophomina phaseolina TaxID=35725 RepID=A0ABQ8GXS0_9PEZI|nr:hypothetical protein B0J12DRAFT_20556 [Macrophomina phaseolina]
MSTFLAFIVCTGLLTNLIDIRGRKYDINTLAISLFGSPSPATHNLVVLNHEMALLYSKYIVLYRRPLESCSSAAFISPLLKAP